MIEITDQDGRVTFLAASAISTVNEIAAPWRQQGLRTDLCLFDGRKFSVCEDAKDIVAQVRLASAPPR